MSDTTKTQEAASIVESDLPKPPSPPAADSRATTSPRTYLIDGRRLPAHPAAELFPLLDPGTPAYAEYLTDLDNCGQLELSSLTRPAFYSSTDATGPLAARNFRSR